MKPKAPSHRTTKYDGLRSHWARLAIWLRA